MSDDELRERTERTMERFGIPSGFACRVNDCPNDALLGSYYCKEHDR